MAFNDVPLGDAGRNYYQQQFGSRVQNIRKSGAAPTSAKPGCLGGGGMAGGGCIAVLIVVRIIIAVAVGTGGSSYNNSYDNNYNDTDTPAIEWTNDDRPDPPMTPDQANPWKPAEVDPPRFPPEDPIFKPDPPLIPDPDPLVPMPDPDPKGDK